MENNDAPISGYEQDPILKDLVIRATGALAMLSVGADENPELRISMARALRRALERATGKSFREYDFSEDTEEAKDAGKLLFELTEVLGPIQ